MAKLVFYVLHGMAVTRKRLDRLLAVRQHEGVEQYRRRIFHGLIGFDASAVLRGELADARADKMCNRSIGY